MKLVDAVAQAIYLVGEDWDTKDGFGSLPEYGKDFWRDRARAALDALSAAGMVVVAKGATPARIEAICEARNLVPNTEWTDGTTEGVQAIERVIAERIHEAMISTALEEMGDG